MNGTPGDKLKTIEEASSDSNLRAFFDITIGETSVGRIVMELYGNVTPKTTENFAKLCQGTETSAVSGAKLAFKGSAFHRIIKGFMCQGGDFTAGNGTGGESIYGDKFADENFILPHDRAGLLSMANAGPNTNGSQFFITTASTPHLNGKHCVFGRVIKGMRVVRRMEETPKGEQDRPLSPVVIADCGALEPGQLDGVQVPVDGDLYEDYPADIPSIPEPSALLSMAVEIKGFGNSHFKQGHLEEAVEKYSKAIRYLDAVHPAPADLTELSLDEKKTFFQTRVSCLLNMAMVELKLERFAAARESTDRALYVHSELSSRTDGLETVVTPADLTKAYFRKAVALKGLKDLKESLVMIQKASALSPADKLISREAAVVTKAIQDLADKEKRMYSRMFS